MDASISDILASVTRAHDAAATTSLPSLQSTTSAQQADLHHLTRAWVAERVAPELLPYPTDLLDRIMERIREQGMMKREKRERWQANDAPYLDRKIETIETRTARMDSGTSFALVIMQTELERFKFLVRSFLRARIAKIDAHPHHLLSLPPTDTPLLSPQETHYLRTHAALLSHHYTTSFLSSFPTKLRRLDDRAGAGSVGMVEGPDVERAVFVRCLGVAGAVGVGARRLGRNGGVLHDGDEGMDDDEDEREGGDGHRYGVVEVSCGYTSKGDGDADEEMHGNGTAGRESGGRASDGGERIIRMRRGEVWLVRWSGVREAVARGECELI